MLIDAYLLGISPPEVRALNAMLDRFNATMDNNNRSIAEALREIEKSNTRLARLKKSRRSRPR